MSKQNHTKKSLWLSVLRVALVVAVIAGVALMAAACNGGKDAEEGIKLYWNVDGVTYRSPDMDRMADSDGNIFVTLSCGGVQDRYRVADMTIANKIDMLDVMGLVFDKEGTVVDVQRVEDISGGYAAFRYYISQIDGNSITCNSSSSFLGLNKTFQVNENTKVWDVSGFGITCGIPGVLAVDDQVIAVMDHDGNVFEVFTIPYKQPADIYWNVERQYNSVSKLSTRVSNMVGKYEIVLACNGEIDTYYTRDMKVVDALDGMAAKCFGLEFDDEGMISKVIHAGTATGGGSAASWYHCTEFDGINVLFERRTGSNAGATGEGILSKYCKIFDVSGNGDSIGEPTDLRVGDQVHCLKDSRGNICLIFVVSRKADSEIYWNVNRMWDSKTSRTTRGPGADGYYRIKVAVLGEQKIVKTKDKAIVQSIDSRAAKCFGLKLEGDEIVKFYTPDATVGGSTFASWYDVTKLENGQITVVKSGSGDTKTGKIAADCEIYNVSANAGMVGEKTQVRVGDRVHTLKNFDGEVCVIFVVSRFENLPVYWNYVRNTKRTPDAEGYYVYEMAYNGKTVTVKTKNKTIAQTIDAQAAKAVALSVSKDGIIYRAMHPKETVNCKGGGTSSWCYVTSVSQYGFKTKKLDSNGNITTTYSESFAGGCRIYNVSTNFINERGEKTTLQVGDFVHCLKDGNGNVSYVFVMERFEDMGVYYNLDRNWTGTDTGRTPDADGLYSFQMAHDGKEVTVKTADPAVAKAIDYEVAKCVGIEFDKNGLAIRALHAKTTQECKGGIGVSYATVTQISEDGKSVTTNKDGTLTTWSVSENANFFNVSPDYENNRGERTTLRVGDFVHCLKGADGKTNYIYIMTRAKVMSVVDHECEHVTEDVTWYEWNGTEPISMPGYYVLTADVTNTSSIRSTINAGEEVTICLNGHTVSSPDRFFSVYGKLNICDHKLADGTYAGKLSSSYTGSGYGGIFYSYNDKGASEVNIYGGILEHTGTLTNGGIGYVGNTSANTYTAVMNIYDGVLTGASTTGSGAGIVISNHSELNMYGGKITNCKTSQKDNINAGAINAENGTFNMSGGILEGNKAYEGGNLRVGPNGVANISGNAIIRNGEATNGGNITVLGELNVKKGATIADGVATGTGDNISAFAAAATVNARVNIEEATISGGDIRLGSNSGTVTMKLTDVTISSDIHVNSGNNTLVVGGKVSLSKVNLSTGKTIEIAAEGLDDASSIAVAMTNVDHAFTTITDSNDAACFKPYDSDLYKVENENNDLYLRSKIAPHIHCDCGGHLNVGDHTSHTATTQWKPWDGTTTLTSGNYYLYDADGDGKITITATKEITAGSDVKICLNGVKVESAVRVFLVRGSKTTTTNLTLTDCQTGGEIKVTGKGIAPFLHSYTNGYGDLQVNIFGGKYYAADNDYTEEGGLIRLGNNTATTQQFYGTLNLYGGELSGGCGEYGGNLIVSPNCTFNMYGGKITGGKATYTGANITVLLNGVLNLLGGEITGGQAGTMGSIYTTPEGTVTVGGSVQITGCTNGNLYVRTGEKVLIHKDGLNNDAKIGILMEQDGVFANITDPADEGCFGTDKANTTVANDGGALSIKATGTTPPEVTHTHCACNDEAKGKANHTCGQITYLPWENDKSLPTSGNYYLTKPVNLTTTYTVAAGTTLNLCLNGQTINSTTRIVKVYGTLNLSDCAERNTDGTYKGKLIGNQTGTTLGPVFYIYSGSTFNLFGGELTVSDTSKVQQAGIGGVQVGTMNMYGGTISGGNVTNNGGNICIFDGGVLRMYGGTIADGTAAKAGGNIFLSKGQLEIHEGATITRGHAASSTGGNIRVDIPSNYGNLLTMDGGTVSYGTTGKGTDMSGGNIDVRNNIARITGGVIEYGEAYEGGNIRVGNDATLILGGNAVIRNGKSENSGGNIAVFSNLVIEGNAEIKDGTAKGMGGNISVFANLSTAVANITMTGGKITGGTASVDAGSVRLAAKDGTVNFTATGGTIGAGTAPSAPGVWVGTGKVTTTVGGKVQIAHMYLSEGKTVTLSTATPLSGTALIYVQSASGAATFATGVTDATMVQYFKPVASGMEVLHDAVANALVLKAV